MDVANAPNFSMEIDKVTSKFQLYKTEQCFVFCKPGNCKCDEGSERSNLGSVGIRSASNIQDNATGKASSAERESKAVLRSPEGVIYFLGEVVRAELDNDKNAVSVDICPATANTPLRSAKLFYVREATSEDANPHLGVTYDNKRYVVPRLANDKDSCEGQRTMHVLSLVSQLVQMQKSGKDLPTPAIVRLIGQ